MQQARRQDFAAGGDKNHKGANFLNTVLGVCSNWGAKHETGAQTLTSHPRWRQPCLCRLVGIRPYRKGL